MRILIDILHPAHVHFFRNFLREMEERGAQVIVTAREKEMTTDLLARYGIEHAVLSRQAPTRLGLAREMVGRTARLVATARRTRPDVFTGIMGPSIAVAGRILGTPSVVFYDTEHAHHTNLFTYPLAHTVCTPECYRGRVLGRHVTYPGYHELAYLHPERFKPDPEALRAFGLSGEEPYFLLRFVSWKSIHDAGRRGLGPEEKRKIVQELEHHGRVVISSEGPIPGALSDRRLEGPPERIHDVIAHARGVVGDSATMASEASVLGVPSVYVSPIRLGYLEEQEQRYGLVRNVSPFRKDAVAAAVYELPGKDVTGGHARLLHDNVDVTRWMIEFFDALF